LSRSYGDKFVVESRSNPRHWLPLFRPVSRKGKNIVRYETTLLSYSRPLRADTRAMYSWVKIELGQDVSASREGLLGYPPGAPCDTINHLSPRFSKRLTLFPHVHEPGWRQRRVADRMLDLAMAEHRLDQPRLDAPVGERVAGRVPELVRMHGRRPIEQPSR
jgi:hypothetical protein